MCLSEVCIFRRICCLCNVKIIFNFKASGRFPGGQYWEDWETDSLHSDQCQIMSFCKHLKRSCMYMNRLLQLFFLWELFWVFWGVLLQDKIGAISTLMQEVWTTLLLLQCPPFTQYHVSSLVNQHSNGNLNRHILFVHVFDVVGLFVKYQLLCSWTEPLLT